MKKPQCSVMIPDPIKTDEKRHCLLPSLSFSGPCRKHANLPAPGKDVCAELCQRKILTDENARLKEQSLEFARYCAKSTSPSIPYEAMQRAAKFISGQEDKR